MNILYNFDLKKDAILKNYKIDKFKNDNLKYSFNNIRSRNEIVFQKLLFYLLAQIILKMKLIVILKGNIHQHL